MYLIIKYRLLVRFCVIGDVVSLFLAFAILLLMEHTFASPNASLSTILAVCVDMCCTIVIVHRNDSENRNKTRPILGFTDLANETISDLQNQNTSTVVRRPNFSIQGRRVSQVKCQEFIWVLKEKDRQFRLDRYNYFQKLKEQNGTINTFESHLALPGDFPHMAAIGWLSKSGGWLYKCGGSLISAKFVLTAAHCTRTPPSQDDRVADPDPKVVKLGATNIDEGVQPIEGYEAIIRNIQHIIPHDDYDYPKKYSDIALLELDEKVKYSFLVHPACLWEFQVFSLTKKAKISGWGATDPSNLTAISPELQAATVDVIEDAYCNDLLKNYCGRNWCGVRDQICAGKLNGAVDTCSGDSGGPLQVKIPLPSRYKLAIHYVIGVTSFGIGCARRNSPGIYTKVSSFLDWIERKVWPYMFDKKY